MTKLTDCVFLFTHGAGAGVNSDFIQHISNDLTSKGVMVKLFEFPYMIKSQLENKRRPPDRIPKLTECFTQEIESQLANLSPNQRLFVGGKSMGGRVASLSAIDESISRKIAGTICFGFPFHPPNKLDKYRGEHLASIETPTLILQGDRDPFGTQPEVESYSFSSHVKIKYLTDGDHSFKPRVKSGINLMDNYQTIIEYSIDFMKAIR